MERKSGVLLHISSLPNRYGIGSFGKECYDFIDFLSASKQKVWEILPLGQTGFGDSPYSSCCSYSYNPYFISLEVLVGKGLLKQDEIKDCVDNTAYVDYGKLYYTRFDILRKAFARFDRKNSAFRKFVRSGKYRDYALYMTIKGASENKAFYDWADEFKYRDKTALNKFARAHRNEIAFWQFLQFEAKTEWDAIRDYAKKKKIEIMGDMPLYVAYDSVDVWANPRYFKLDERLFPEKVAGVPPDYFSKTGQLWGNPVYNYEVIKADKFRYWTRRFADALKTCDLIRIDHFRGFDRYYEIDYGRENAMVGEWVEVPSEELFKAVHRRIKRDKIVAEDLGIIDDGVRALLDKQGYPGMRILSFAFNGEEDNLYLPENIEENSVCYTGTHDNDTLMGLLNAMSEWDYKNFVTGVKASAKKLRLRIVTRTKSAVAKAVIRLGYASKANTFIIPMQDVALLNGDYRMNTPGREIANWTVKMPKFTFGKKYAKYLRELTKKYKR